MADRMISDVLTKPDSALEMTLRPSLFSDFTGQSKVKERLEIAVAQQSTPAFREVPIFHGIMQQMKCCSL
jgi:Holliday junction resolvasome RuvABC ATP-dependent DNA helicase subunit